MNTTSLSLALFGFRSVINKGAFILAFCVSFCGCSTIFKRQEDPFKKGKAYLNEPTRPFLTLGTVKSKVDFRGARLDDDFDENCNLNYLESVRELVELSKKNGGDAVAQVKSIVYLLDGKIETYSKPECVDEGEEAQILTQGIVIKFKDKVDEPNK